MTKNIEIEFKTSVSSEKYQELLQLFNLENNIFKQTNHYFDTDDFNLNKEKIVLRIRQKGENHFKVTLKSQSEKGAFESHVLLNKDQAKEMIDHGFQTKDFFEDLDYFVTFKASLDNYRVSTPYKGGTLFLDRCEYCNVVDYEIEYEVCNYDEGQKLFTQFVDEHQIEMLPTKRKSERAFTCKR
ncbi:MAG: CYTH domain-containing protein [Acholeplasmataceae bacterium]|nr:CYTH domain-containing protein [Acholeplasmataceae bacterium]